MLDSLPLLPFITASALLALAPGPDNLFVLAQSALYGARAGLLVTLGLMSGLVVHTSLVALGLGGLIGQQPGLFVLLTWIGGAYLLYLAWQAWTAPLVDIESDNQPRLPAQQLYRCGVIMNLSNPKVTLFFLAFLPQFTVPESGSFMAQIALLGFLFLLTALVIFSLIALLAGQLGRWLKQSPLAQHNLNRVSALVMAGLALRLIWSA